MLFFLFGEAFLLVLGRVVDDGYVAVIFDANYVATTAQTARAVRVHFEDWKPFGECCGEIFGFDCCVFQEDKIATDFPVRVAENV